MTQDGPFVVGRIKRLALVAVAGLLALCSLLYLLWMGQQDVQRFAVANARDGARVLALELEATLRKSRYALRQVNETLVSPQQLRNPAQHRESIQATLNAALSAFPDLAGIQIVKRVAISCFRRADPGLPMLRRPAARRASIRRTECDMPK